MTAVEDAAGGLTRYDYDLMSKLTKLTDAEDHATAFHYDSHGRVDPRWTPRNRPFVDGSKPAISELASETSRGLLRSRLLTQVGVDLGAPAARAALEHVGVMQQAIE